MHIASKYFMGLIHSVYYFFIKRACCTVYTVLVHNNSDSVCTRMNADTDDDDSHDDKHQGGMDPAVNPILATQGGAVMVRETKTRRDRAVLSYDINIRYNASLIITPSHNSLRSNIKPGRKYRFVTFPRLIQRLKPLMHQQNGGGWGKSMRS